MAIVRCCRCRQEFSTDDFGKTIIVLNENNASLNFCEPCSFWITHPILYLCDGKNCGETCPNPKDCQHTTDIRHAVDFVKDISGVGFIQHVPMHWPGSKEEER